MEQRRGWGRVMPGGKRHADFRTLPTKSCSVDYSYVTKRFPFQYSALFGLIDCRDAEDQPIFFAHRHRSNSYYRFAISCTCARVFDHIC